MLGYFLEQHNINNIMDPASDIDTADITEVCEISCEISCEIEIKKVSKKRKRKDYSLIQSKKYPRREKQHIVSLNCPGWQKFGWMCMYCNTQFNEAKLVLNCPECDQQVREWNCGCLTNSICFETYMIKKRISLYWTGDKSWYNGQIIKNQQIVTITLFCLIARRRKDRWI